VGLYSWVLGGGVCVVWGSSATWCLVFFLLVSAGGVRCRPYPYFGYCVCGVWVVVLVVGWSVLWGVNISSIVWFLGWDCLVFFFVWCLCVVFCYYCLVCVLFWGCGCWFVGFCGC